jgi:hypothetical protein
VYNKKRLRAQRLAKFKAAVPADLRRPFHVLSFLWDGQVMPSDFESPLIAVGSVTQALNESDALSVGSPNACIGIPGLDNQLSLQPCFLRKARIAYDQLAESIQKLQEALDGLSVERNAIMASLNKLREAALAGTSAMAPLYVGSTGLSFQSRTEFWVSNRSNEPVASFKLAVYIHIPKCSGSSMLWPYFQAVEERVRWHGINASVFDMQQGIPGDYAHPSALYCGHFDLHHIESKREMFPDCDIKYFAHFRDPMERAISYYNYIARTEDSPEHHMVTEFSDDLSGWFGDLLLSQSQVQFLSPSPSLGSEAVPAIISFIRNGRLRLFDSRNVLGCASEVNLHTGIYLPRHAHSEIRNKDLSFDVGAGLSSLSNLSSLPLLQQLCQGDLDFWKQVKSQGILS